MQGFTNIVSISDPVIAFILGKDGEQFVILLAGGTKRRQQDDIENAQASWQDYKRRKTGGR